MKRGLMAAAALAACLAAGDGIALAQQTPPAQSNQTRTTRRDARRARIAKRVARRFRAADKNGDGVISRDEWSRRPRAFDRLDTNHDGVVSADELNAAIAARMKRHRR
jgi:hypothetical protein